MDDLYIDALKALSDPNRLRLFWLLVHVDQRVTVAEAMDVTQDTQYNVSRNLKMLFKAGLLTQEKQGKWVLYTLADQKLTHCKLLVDSVRKLPTELFEDELQRCLIRLSMRVNGECVVGANSDEFKTALQKSRQPL
ncbi:ArsR/SmtB family transcription factor [Neptunomonas sp.]|uniref:ArsR/SmtB family transcription factor n=1 Tax=Neptunomonas sp. TaxID=1971898 RepID=UPI003569D98D